MVKAKEPVNPCYVAVAALGIVFVITACAYATMLYRAMAPAVGDAAAGNAAGRQLMAFLDRYGMRLMTIELVLLGAATFGAIWLDRFRAQGGILGRRKEGEDDFDHKGQNSRKIR